MRKILLILVILSLLVLSGCTQERRRCKEYWKVHSNISLDQQGIRISVNDGICRIQKGWGGGVAYHKVSMEVVRKETTTNP